MSKGLREIVFGEEREKRYVEGTVLGGIICPIIKINGYEVYIYGCSGGILPFVLWLKNNGVEVKAVFDKNKEKAGQYILNGIPVIHCDDMHNIIRNPENSFIIINVVPFMGITQMEITNLLYKNNIIRYYSVTDIEREHIYAGIDRRCVSYFRNHIDDLEALMSLLGDRTSKNILTEYIRMYVQGGTYSLRNCKGSVKYFYGEDIIYNKKFEELYLHLENEVWINCGTSIGDNIFLYFANGLKAEKIYAFEGDKNIFGRFCENLKYLPEEYRKKVIPLNTFIDENTEFSKIIGDDKITFINADIEGNELELLKNIPEIIIKDRPVLAICVYHKIEDLIEIPNFISSLVDGYNYILRKYDAYTSQASNADELVLYAIPDERNINIK